MLSRGLSRKFVMCNAALVFVLVYGEEVLVYALEKERVELVALSVCGGKVGGVWAMYGDTFVSVVVGVVVTVFKLCRSDALVDMLLRCVPFGFGEAGAVG